MGKTRNSANLVSDNNLFIDIANDRVGVGTTTPQYKVDVVGDINFTGSLNQGGSPFVASRWTTGTGDDIYRLSGNVGIGTTNPLTKFDVIGNSYVSGNVGIGTTNPLTKFDVIGNSYVSGNVGIGTTNPQYKLDVTGIVSATSYRGDGSQLTGVGGELDITSSLFI
jgi:hypothetical protein